MELFRLLQHHRLLCAHDVLHSRGRLDDVLLLGHRDGHAFRSRGSGAGSLFQSACQPGHHAFLDACRLPRMLRRVRARSSEGRGARGQNHDGRTARHRRRPCRAFPHSARQHEGRGLLSRARPSARHGRRHHVASQRRHESGLLHPEHRHRRHVHFRQLSQPGQHPDQGIGVHRFSGHLRGVHVGPHHFPGVLRLRRAARRRPRPHLHHAAQHLQQHGRRPLLGRAVLRVHERGCAHHGHRRDGKHHLPLHGHLRVDEKKGREDQLRGAHSLHPALHFRLQHLVGHSAPRSGFHHHGSGGLRHQQQPAAARSFSACSAASATAGAGTSSLPKPTPAQA